MIKFIPRKSRWLLGCSILGLTTSISASSTQLTDEPKHSSYVATVETLRSRETREYSDDELVSQLTRLNPEKALVIQNDYPSMLKAVWQFFRETNDWKQAQVRGWCDNFRRASSTHNDVAALQKMLAVLSRAVQLVHGHAPRSNQLISVWSLLTSLPQGRLIQVATGQGKSLITAMAAAANVLLGNKVDIFSSSEVLCDKDFEEQRKFYECMAISSGLISQGRCQPLVFKTEIVYGSASSFEGAYLNGFDTIRDFKSRLLLIDEVDSLLIDQLSIRTLLSNATSGMDHTLPILTYMYAHIEEILHEKTEGSLDRASIIEKVISRTMSALNGEIEGLTFAVPEHLAAYTRMYIPIWAKSAYDVYFDSPDIEFVHNDTNILVVDNLYTGTVQTNQIYSKSRHQFLQIKYYRTLNPERLVSEYISHLSFIKRYESRIFGMSGTLGNKDEHNFLKKLFNTDLMLIPSFCERVFEESPPIVLEDVNEWHNAILDSVKDVITHERAALVLFESIKRLRAFQTLLEQHNVQVITYNRNDLNDKIPEEIKPGAIILSTNLGGRGTEILK